MQLHNKYNRKQLKEQLQKDTEFVTLLGEILTEIIINQSVKHDTTRNDDTEEFNLL